MKLYQIVLPGSAPVLMKPETRSITLGGGQTETVVPIIGEGPEVRAKKTDNGIVLVRGDWNDTDGRCLATCSDYSRRRGNFILYAKGVQIITSGTFPFRFAVGIGMCLEILAIVHPGATFRLKSRDSTWYKWTGSEWVFETPKEQEGEWL